MAKENEKKVENKSSNKAKKPNKIARWFKDLRGEIKKIFWPDGKTVFRNTLIVLIVVAIAAAVIYLFDQGMSLGLKGIKKLAADKKETTASDEATGETSQEALESITETETEGADTAE